MGKKGQRTGEVRVCEFCGNDFYAFPIQIRMGHGKYCSRICKGKAQVSKRKTCLTCGKELKQTSGCKRGKYCSYECFGKSIRNRIECVCEQCGKKFETHPSDLVRKNRGRFCSKACFDEFQRKGHQKYECKVCGKTISRRGRRKYQYCSTRCSHSAQQRRKGLNGLEIVGGKILKEMGVDFEEQVLLFNKFRVDVFLRWSNLVIQWDGDYWHGNPRIYRTLSGIQVEKNKRDKACNAYLRKCGLTVLRFWERDIKRRPEWVAEEIRRVMG